MGASGRKRATRKRGSATRELAAGALSTGATIAVAASTAGVSQSTIRRWQQSDPSFGARVDTLVRDTTEPARARIRATLERAAAELDAELEDEDVGVRHRAAVALLDRGGLGVQRTHTIEERPTASTDELVERAERALRVLRGGKRGDGAA